MHRTGSKSFAKYQHRCNPNRNTSTVWCRLQDGSTQLWNLHVGCVDLAASCFYCCFFFALYASSELFVGTNRKDRGRGWIMLNPPGLAWRPRTQRPQCTNVSSGEENIYIYILYIAIVQHLPDVSRQEAPGVRFPGLAISRTRSTTKMDRKM